MVKEGCLMTGPGSGRDEIGVFSQQFRQGGRVPCYNGLYRFVK